MSPPDDGLARIGMVQLVDSELKVWPTLDPAALCGLAGDVVSTIGPHTEADPVAILVQYLAAAGNAIGRGPHYAVEGDRHGANLYAVLVGNTAKGRKGTSWARVRQIMAIADQRWATDRVHSGLSSGEGLIWHVRDPIVATERQGRGADRRSVEYEADPGIADKRLYVIEPEFGGVLTVARRDGNILSRIVRDAWDRGDLATLTKNSPARATGAHVSIVGHVTADELRALLDRVAIANGLANRFLWLAVRRSRVLPFGGALDDECIVELGRRSGEAIERARTIGQVAMTGEAREAWRRVYPDLSEGRPGLVGSITARAEAQVVRLALIYALLVGSAGIGAEHLRAGLAVWEYAEASARHIWGDAIGDPVADEIWRALRAAPDGMTRTAIRDHFGRNRGADEIGRALAALAQHGRARRVSRPDTGGRPAETWIAEG